MKIKNLSCVFSMHFNFHCSFQENKLIRSSVTTFSATQPPLWQSFPHNHTDSDHQLTNLPAKSHPVTWITAVCSAALVCFTHRTAPHHPKRLYKWCLVWKLPDRDVKWMNRQQLCSFMSGSYILAGCQPLHLAAFRSNRKNIRLLLLHALMV